MVVWKAEMSAKSGVAYVPNDLINIMGLYFEPSMATPQIFDIMRRSIFTEQKAGIPQKADIPYSLILQSQAEIAEMRLRIDSITPYFQQDINKLVLGNGNNRNGNGTRAIFLTTADYLGQKGEVVREDAVIARNLGTNPWSLYRGERGYDSVDTRITAEFALEFISGNEAALERLGVERVFVKTSCFFYVRDKDLREKGFIKADEQVNLDSLVTYLADTSGMVGVSQVQKPTPQEYAKRAVPSNSSRQKQTLDQKVRRELCQYKPFRNAGDVISDWGGHRITAATEQDAVYWGTVFGSDGSVGSFKTEVLHVDNYYEKPKGTGFKSFNIALRTVKNSTTAPRNNGYNDQTTSPRHPKMVREVQIYDLQQHFNGQINEASPAYHRRFRRSETESSKKRQDLMDTFEYTDILRLMFNSRDMVFPVKS